VQGRAASARSLWSRAAFIPALVSEMLLTNHEQVRSSTYDMGFSGEDALEEKPAGSTGDSGKVKAGYHVQSPGTGMSQPRSVAVHSTDRRESGSIAPTFHPFSVT
jgi:hypothetical protein